MHPWLMCLRPESQFGRKACFLLRLANYQAGCCCICYELLLTGVPGYWTTDVETGQVWHHLIVVFSWHSATRAWVGEQELTVMEGAVYRPRAALVK